MRKVIFLLIGAAVAGCKPETHQAQIDVEGGASVALIVSPMFSLQSDWQRKLLIEAPTGSLETDLFEDTGWWRGSNLYRHLSGVYVLHEGQGGCVLFRVSPPALVRDAEISCDKTEQIPDEDTAQVGKSLAGFPASKFYSDFQYIGTFMEIPQGQEAIGFFGADEQAEVELSDIL
jgi:hypothetical protein